MENKILQGMVKGMAKRLGPVANALEDAGAAKVLERGSELLRSVEDMVERHGKRKETKKEDDSEGG